MNDLAAELINRPLALGDNFVPGLIEKLAVARLEPAARAAGCYASAAPYSVRDGVAIVPVGGKLVGRETWYNAALGFTSYEALGWALDAAVADRSISSIVLDLSSGGGSVSGFEGGMLAVRKANAVKPITAHVNSMAASAAYGLASQASRIVLAPGATVGSIGIIYVHVDVSAALAKEGLKPTIITAGATKADETELLPLSDRGRASITEEINDLYSMFCRMVGEGRGSRFTASAARATEARVYAGQKAVRAGLADAVAGIDDVIATLRPARSSVRGARVEAPQPAPAAETSEIIRAEIKPGVWATFATKAEFDAYLAAIVTEAAKKAHDEAASEWRRREEIGKAIRALPDADDYPTEAEALISEGVVTVEGARAILEGLHRAGVPTSKQKSQEAMTEAFLDRKLAAGALVTIDGVTHNDGSSGEGVNVGAAMAEEFSPQVAEQERNKASWARAVAKANAKFEAGAVST